MNVISFGMPYGPFCNPLELQTFLENGGWALLSACIKENGHGLDFSELLHELVITASRCIDRYDERCASAKLTTYIWDACKKTILMAHRKQNSKENQTTAAVVSLEEVKGRSTEFEEFEDTLIEKLESERRAKILYSVINDPSVLDEDERIVICLTLSGCSQTYISQVAGISQGQVSKRFTDAKKKLGPALKSAGI